MRFMFALTPYGYAHQRSRAAWDGHLEQVGSHPCRRCGDPVYPDSLAHLNVDGRPFDLGHGVPVKLGGDGGDSEPEHAACNRRAAAAMTNAPRASREW